MKKKVLIGIITGAILVVAIVLGAIFLMPKDNGEPMYTTTTTEMHTHEFGEWEIVFLPTCEMEGKEQRVCACGETISQAIAKVDHSFGNWETVNAATCSEEGERKGFCEYCHLEKSETIPATEIHTLSTIVPEFDYCGEEQVRSVYCSVCEEYVTSFGHHYIKSVIEATCTEDGEIRYTCDKCGDSYYTVISAHGHIESDEQITMNPTCEGQGLANVTCIICDTLLEVVTLESTGHEYTCTSANGKMTYTCTKCSHSYYEAINDDDLSVTFMSDGEEITKVYVAEGTAVTYMPTLTKEGYDLAYWAIDDGTNAPYDSQYIYEDTILVAVWEEVTVLDTHYSDISNFPSVETSFTFKVVAENEEQIRKNLTIYDIGDNEVEYSVRALGGGKYEISSDSYNEGEFYYAIAEGNVTFVGTESREIQFSIAGENRVEIEISDSVKWLEYSDVYGVIDGNNEKLLLTKNTFSVGDNVAIFEDTHENIVLVIKILSVGEQMGYNAYGFEMADYEEVFNKMDVNFTGDLSDGTLTIDPAAEENIRSAFMSSSLYASARCAAMDFAKQYNRGINKEKLDIKLAINSDHLVVTVKYTIEFEENIEINIICTNKYYVDFEFDLKSISKYAAILTTTNYQTIEVNLSASTDERDPKFSDAKKAYLENLKKYLENKKEDFMGVEPSNFDKNEKYIAVGGVDLYISGVNLRFSLGLELNFEASGTLETELRMTTVKTIGVRNGRVVNSLDIDITGIDFYVQGKARVELLLRVEIFINVCGIGVYGNVALGPYIEFGGVGAFSYDGNKLYITQNSAYIDAGHRQELNVGFKAELYGIVFYQKEFELFGRDHSFNGMPIGNTQVWLGFKEYEGNVYIEGDCSSMNQFDLADLINTTIKYQDLKGDLGIEYLTPDSIIHSLNSVSGYRSRITFTNDKITFNSIGEEVTLEIKVKVNDLIYKTVVVHYTVNHEDGCSHYSCDKGYHVGGTTTCTERAICSRCDIEYGPEPVGHVYMDGKCTNCRALKPSEGLEFRLLSDGTYAVWNIGECTDTNIIIPATYNGIPVTEVGGGNFNNSFVTSIILPETITSVSSAIMNCTSLKYNEYDDAKYLGTEDNPYFVLIRAKNTEIYDCEIHPDTKVIADYAFSDCIYMRQITIPNSVEHIGSGAFYFCLKLSTITIPNSVSKISNYTFKGCIYLSKIVIPDSVTSIGIGAFYGCESLKNLTLGNNLTTIESDAFRDCTSLTSITIPDSVTEIGGYSFFNCRALKSIVLPDAITAISDNLFCYCVSLQEITMGEGVTSIGKYAFQCCEKLESITIPNSVVSIGDSAFYLCKSLESIMFEGTVERWNSLGKGLEWNYNSGRYTIYCNNGEIAKSGTITYN